MRETILRRLLFVGLLGLALLASSLTRQLAPTLPAELSARTAPIFGLGYRLGSNLHAAIAALYDRRDLRAENRAMRQEIATLRLENAQLREENRRLNAALQVREQKALGAKAIAPVIDEDLSGLYRRLIIGLGEKDGLKVGDPVVATGSAGLVGVIVSVTPKEAVVRTLVDPESRVAILLPGRRGRGVAFGQPPRLLRVELSPDAEVKVGDRVESGAFQGLYPRLPVGEVVEVLPLKPGALKRVVMVRPLVQFSLLEEVMVLRSL
ncbi:rod shape-determining protein MreC [Calidithermus timidus]|uniref:rod shape-determining protein MreC n=1 Tax=Calidithermus timidus TaxID=307124 RepID=UPI000366F791|nr:rod shape-determining protein MreC [Calidithermus timidus]